ncbi:MAG: orotate phosphoribosyltransferase [Candidatus Brocadiia bacterium]
MPKTGPDEKVFTKLEAVQKGHFLLTSGNHSDTYVQCSRILERPDVSAKLCKKLVQPWMNKGISLVAGPALGGIVLAYEAARPLKARAIYLERVDNQMTLRRGFAVKPGEKVLVGEDVITTGGSVKEVVDVITKNGGKVVGIISLVDRRPDKTADVLGYKYNAVIRVSPPIYKPDQCPLCKQGIPAVKPGSRGLK